MAEKRNTDIIIRMIKAHQPRTVSELATIIKAGSKIDEEEFVDIIRDMVVKGSLKLEPPTYPIHSFLDYLFTVDTSSWFWLTIMASGLAAVLAVLPSGFPLFDVCREFFGSIFLLFLPGYSCLQLLFPTYVRFEKFHRCVLSIPVSFAIIAITGYALNYAMSGIRLYPLIETVGVTTTLLSISGAFRAYKHDRIP